MDQLENSSIDAVFVVWGTMYLLWTYSLLVDDTPDGLLAALYLLAGVLFAGLFFLAALQRLPLIGYVVVGVIELNYAIGLVLEGGSGGLSFVADVVPELAPAMFLATLVIASLLFGRAIHGARNGEALLPVSIGRE